MDTLKDRLRTAREEMGASQGALAQLSGCSQSLIGNLEAGSQYSSTKIPLIARALGVEALWLAEGKGSKRRGVTINSTLAGIADPGLDLNAEERQAIEQLRGLPLEDARGFYMQIARMWLHLQASRNAKKVRAQNLKPASGE